jgi:predicted porin
LQFGAGYSFDTGETALYAASETNQPIPSNIGFGTGNKMRALTAAVQYQSGPVIMVASYDKAIPSETITRVQTATATIANPESASPQAWYVGVGYTIDSVLLSAAWGRGINGAFSGSGPGNDLIGTPLASITGNANMLFSKGFDQNAYLLGLSWAIDSKTQLMTSLQMLKPTGQLALTPGVASQKIVSAAVTHSLSPRTTVYIWASYGNNFQLSTGATASVIGSGIQTMF